MHPKIYCLMWSGFITDEVKDMLFRAACFMTHRSLEKLKIKNGFVEGAVTTNRTPAILGSVAGTIFRAEVESESGKTDIKYLVRTGDIEELAEAAAFGFWTDRSWAFHPAENAQNN